MREATGLRGPVKTFRERERVWREVREEKEEGREEDRRLPSSASAVREGRRGGREGGKLPERRLALRSRREREGAEEGRGGEDRRRNCPLLSTLGSEIK